MRKSHAETLALSAMRDAMADGQDANGIVYAGAMKLWSRDITIRISRYDIARARALYDKHFTVKDAN